MILGHYLFLEIKLGALKSAFAEQVEEECKPFRINGVNTELSQIEESKSLKTEKRHLTGTICVPFSEDLALMIYMQYLSIIDCT
jgi:hypothetical protein